MFAAIGGMMPSPKEKKIYTDFAIVSTPKYVRFRCPYCHRSNENDYDDYIEDELWSGMEAATCWYCGKTVELNGAIDEY